MNECARMVRVREPNGHSMSLGAWLKCASAARILVLCGIVAPATRPEPFLAPEPSLPRASLGPRILVMAWVRPMRPPLLVESTNACPDWLEWRTRDANYAPTLARSALSPRQARGPHGGSCNDLGRRAGLAGVGAWLAPPEEPR